MFSSVDLFSPPSVFKPPPPLLGVDGMFYPNVSVYSILFCFFFKMRIEEVLQISTPILFILQEKYDEGLMMCYPVSERGGISISVLNDR